jgi:hypothetical protein
MKDETIFIVSNIWIMGGYITQEIILILGGIFWFIIYLLKTTNLFEKLIKNI